MVSVLIFLVILALLVLSHEFGHFAVAKLFNVRVDEFGFGFPPKLFSFKKGETEYSLNLLPFGGFVRIFGENVGEGERDTKRSFSHQSNFIQASIIVAGVVFNFLLAWLLLSLGFMKGMPVPADFAGASYNLKDQKLIVTDIMSGSPADLSGLKVNDSIVYLVAADKALQDPSGDEVVNFIGERGGSEIIMGYKRMTSSGELGDTQILRVIPKEGLVASRAAIGIGLDEIGILQLPAHKAIYVGGVATYSLTLGTFYGLYDFVKGIFFDGSSALSSVSGPIGLIGIVGETASLGYVYLLGLIALISINLGVLNIIPFPALDGGRLLFIVLGAIRRKPIKTEIQNYVNVFGFVFLILLMIVITWSDILKFLQ